MTETFADDDTGHGDGAPGDARLDGSGVAQGVLGYVLGLALAGGLTAASFLVAGSQLVWGPGIPAALVALAVAQMGVHLVFFLHITTGPESTNNVLALAFGVLIVFLLLVGTMFIMSSLDHTMMPIDQVMSMQR